MSKKDKQQALVPRLRFPEFRDAPQWEEKQLGDEGEFLSSLTGKTAKDFDTGDASFIPYMNVFSNTFTDMNDLRAVHVDANESQNTVSKGDVFFTVSSETPEDAGMSSILLDEIDNCYLNSFCALFRFREGNSPVPRFLGYLLRSRTPREHLVRGAQGGTRYNISKSTFRTISLLLPSPAEQQKIADCLGSLDDLIAAEGRKLAALRDHKNGLMQQLFPREGETRPRLRFPEFLDAGEWKERLIEEFFLVGSSKRVLQQDWTTEGVPFYRTRELVSLSKNERFSSEVFISEELFTEITENYGVPVEGDFLVSGVGTLGIAYQVRAGDRFYFKDGNVLWLKLTGDLISDFFKYCFQSDFIQNQISGQASVSTVGTYTIQNAKKTRFLCPVETDEQQRIADCLSALDTMIAAQAEKLDALRTHKRGLTQQLFPSLEDFQ